ncbi:MAG: hypothetical protein WC637_02530 [Victivallales bacterium]
MESDRFIKSRVNGWDWHLINPGILEPWFHSWKQIAKKNMIKSSCVRAVFRVETDKAAYYVKYNYPLSLTSKIHSSFIPKSKSEFYSSLLLEEEGISVVEICGWGRRGTESMLITKELEDSVNARNLWFSEERMNPQLKKAFLDSLSDFLGKFMSSGFYHPDFHLGNMMIRRSDMGFVLVDTHGIEKKKKLRDSQYFRMVRVIGALRGEITDREAGELILKSLLAKDYAAADEIWYRILEAEAAEIEKLWDKREKQIMAGTGGKYCRVFKTAEGYGISVRNSVSGQSLVDKKVYLQGELEKVYEPSELNKSEARDLWLTSFRLQFHRIPHRMPIAWICKDQNRSVLLYRKNNPGPVKRNEKVGEFLKRCRVAGIKHDISGRLSVHRGSVLISDLNNLTFH